MPSSSRISVRGRARTTQTPSTVAADESDDPLALSPVKAKKRARKVRQAEVGLRSGLRSTALEVVEHQWMEEGEGGVDDLVPPSDEEELEEWRNNNASQLTMDSQSSRRKGTARKSPGQIVNRRSSSLLAQHHRHISQPEKPVLSRSTFKGTPLIMHAQRSHVSSSYSGRTEQSRAGSTSSQGSITSERMDWEPTRIFRPLFSSPSFRGSLSPRQREKSPALLDAESSPRLSQRASTSTTHTAKPLIPPRSQPPFSTSPSPRPSPTKHPSDDGNEDDSIHEESQMMIHVDGQDFAFEGDLDEGGEATEEDMFGLGGVNLADCASDHAATEHEHETEEEEEEELEEREDGDVPMTITSSRNHDGLPPVSEIHPIINLNTTRRPILLSSDRDTMSPDPILRTQAPHTPSPRAIPNPSPSASLPSQPAASSVRARQESHPRSPSPANPPADPALEQFRTARTFRTRTKLQLQPYTKERQLYEAALRRGGLKSHKRTAPADHESLPTAILPISEEPAPASSGSEMVEPERIVIGNTPPPPKMLELLDIDYDEYFTRFGKAAEEEDEDAREVLQDIARERLREAKMARRKAREARRAEKAFARLVRGQEEEELREAQGVAASEDEVAVPTPARPMKSLRTPGRQKTYSKKDRIPAPEREVSEGLPELPPPLPPPPYDPVTTSSAGLSIHTPGSPGNGHVMGMDIDYSADQPDYVVDFNNFDVTSRPLTKRAQTISSDSDSGTNSDASSEAEDKRVRIARRMLPAAMLRKLEQEAAAKELRKADVRRRDARRVMESPARPGRAVVKRAAGQVHLEDLLGEVADVDEESLPRDYHHETPTRVVQRELIVISDDDTDDSQAHEEDVVDRSLARLYRGDFESIIAGRSKAPVRTEKALHKPGIKTKSARRPAIGLVRRMKMPGTVNKEYQTRLDFPSGDISPTRPKSVKKAKTTGKVNRKTRTSRPAIQLDDHVIFATADFAFETEAEQSQPRTPKGRPVARIFQRTTSKTISEPDVLDAGIGKARSWANFDKFPIDFGISPLPSGLFCSADTIVGDGSVARLIELVNGSMDDLAVGVCFGYDVELSGDMDPSAVLAVLGIVFQGVQKSIFCFINYEDAGLPDFGPISFLAQYIPSYAGNPDEITTLRTQCLDAARNLTEKLNGSLVSGSRITKAARDSTLRARWELLRLAIRISSPLGTACTVVEDCATGLLRQLLNAGFDKTIKPLKAILRGEAETAEITDPTITAWIAVMHALTAFDRKCDARDTFFASLEKALESSFHLDQTGPIAAERIWFLIFGLCALSQFDVHGRITTTFTPVPRWQLVRRAVSLIRISHNEEAEERAHQEQLRGRDRYIKTIMARCVRLSSTWKWHFDKESFSVATKDLGVIFKERQYRNLPTEHPVDFPDWITQFDVSLTANEDTKHETAFELYLRLVCVAASDIIGSTTSLIEAQQAERDVQRLIMSIIPVSPVRFNRILPPTPKQLGQLVNRYAAVVAGCYFSPALLGWLLANSRKWAPFESADFESRQISIRGLMYLAIALRHHEQSVEPVVERFADIMGILQRELEDCQKEGARRITRNEVERTMVLVVACFKIMILHHSFDTEKQLQPSYPDPSLLHESWIARAFALDLNKDLKCAAEVVSTIQAYLDTRSAALPRLAKQRSETREKAKDESEDSYSFGMCFTDGDLLALGGEPQAEDPVQKADEDFGQIITSTISPKIYKLLSDMLPSVLDESISADAIAERQVFITRLTKCWSDCAGVVVIEQNAPNGWTRYIGSFGQESWQRIRNEQGRMQVGLHFMLNVAKIDPSCFKMHEEDFIALLFQCIVTDRLTIEHKYFSALMSMPGVLGHPLLSDLSGTEYVKGELDRTTFMQVRGTVLEVIFAGIPHIFRSQHTKSSTKSLTYRCVNLLVSSLVSNEKNIPITKVIHRESYHAFAAMTIQDLQRLTGHLFTPTSVPALKAFA